MPAPCDLTPLREATPLRTIMPRIYPDVDDLVRGLEAQLAQHVMCGKKGCDRPAEFRSLGHKPKDCHLPTPGGELPPFHLCRPCLVRYNAVLTGVLARKGFIDCSACGAEFPDIATFCPFERF